MTYEAPERIEARSAGELLQDGGEPGLTVATRCFSNAEYRRDITRIAAGCSKPDSE